MQKKLKNKTLNILFIVVAIVFAFANTSLAENMQPTVNQNVSKQVEQKAINAKSTSNQVSIPKKNIDTIKNLKKDSARLKIVKFFMAMFGVFISAVFIWLGLKLYKKYLQNKVLSSNNTTYGDSLETPKDFKSALNLFLEKTDE